MSISAALLITAEFRAIRAIRSLNIEDRRSRYSAITRRRYSRFMNTFRARALCISDTSRNGITQSRRYMGMRTNVSYNGYTCQFEHVKRFIGFPVGKHTQDNAGSIVLPAREIDPLI